MNIAIYQIAPDRDENNVAFLNYENLERFQGSAALRSEIYDKVFEGEVECGTLEEVYQMKWMQIRHTALESPLPESCGATASKW